MKRRVLAVSVAAIGSVLMAMQPAHAQRQGAASGVGFADDKAPVEGPTTIAGDKAFVSPIPYFRDLGPWDPDYKAPRTAEGKPDLQRGCGRRRR